MQRKTDRKLSSEPLTLSGVSAIFAPQYYPLFLVFRQPLLVWRHQPETQRLLPDRTRPRFLCRPFLDRPFLHRPLLNSSGGAPVLPRENAGLRHTVLRPGPSMQTHRGVLCLTPIRTACRYIQMASKSHLGVARLQWLWICVSLSHHHIHVYGRFGRFAYDSCSRAWAAKPVLKPPVMRSSLSPSRYCPGCRWQPPKPPTFLQRHRDAARCRPPKPPTPSRVGGFLFIALGLYAAGMCC